MSGASTGLARGVRGTRAPYVLVKVKDSLQWLLTFPSSCRRLRSTRAPASCPMSCRWSMSGKDEWLHRHCPVGSSTTTSARSRVLTRAHWLSAEQMPSSSATACARLRLAKVEATLDPSQRLRWNHVPSLSRSRTPPFHTTLEATIDAEQAEDAAVNAARSTVRRPPEEATAGAVAASAN